MSVHDMVMLKQEVGFLKAEVDRLKRALNRAKGQRDVYAYGLCQLSGYPLEESLRDADYEINVILEGE